MIPYPQTEKLPNGGADTWDQGAAGEILTREVFAPLPPTVGFRSLALLPVGLALFAGLAGLNVDSARADSVEQIAATAAAPVAVTSSNADGLERVTASTAAAIAASATLVDQPELITAAAGAGATLNGSQTDGLELSTAAASAAVAGSSVLADGLERLQASATAGSLGFRSLAVLPLGVGLPPIAAASLSATLTDSLEISQAQAAIAVALAGVQTNGAELIQASASVRPLGLRSLALLPIGLSAPETGPIAAFSATLTDGFERLVSTAGPGVLLTSINGTSAYRIESVPDLEVGDRVEVLSAVGGPATDVTILPDATFSVAPGSTVVSFDVRVWSISEQTWSGPVTQYVAAQIVATLVDAAERVVASVAIAIGLSGTVTDGVELLQSSAGAAVTQLAATQVDQVERLTAAAAAPLALAADQTDSLETISASAALPLALAGSLTDAVELLQASGGADAAIFDATFTDGVEQLLASSSAPASLSSALVDAVEVQQAAGLLTVGFSLARPDGLEQLVALGNTVFADIDSTLTDGVERLIAESRDGALRRVLRTVRVAPPRWLLTVEPLIRRVAVPKRFRT